MTQGDAVPETPLDQRSNLSDEEFFGQVASRNTKPDGETSDPQLFRRLSHPICQRCQQKYRQKFPGRPFQIRCQGIYTEGDFVEIAAAAGMEYVDVREILDIPYWASRHVQIPNSEGDLVYFQARDYQCETLWCTTPRQVDRWGRGMGKTQVSIIKEVHTATTRKRYNILVACPAKAQAQKWFDDINSIIQADPGLRGSLVQTRQQPYYTFRFSNGSTINIFTTGSQSGRDADVVRSQSPRRVCIDEQDLLNPGDYKAIMPLLRRYQDSEFHGMSTPTGKRETFWQMCNEYPDYRELHFPISRHPDWTTEMEAACKREARTDLNYLHEFLAEFGEQEGGVFKSVFVDAAKKPYEEVECEFEKGWRYYLGVDWNGQGTGSRMRVVGYNLATRKRKAVDHSAVNTSTMDTLEEIRLLNKRWHCEGVYTDAGFGYVQDELLKLIGYNSSDRDDRALLNVKVVDFGANMVTNKLVPNRGNNKYQQQQELERPTKPFMVEGACMVLEMGDFEFSDRDKLLEEQLRAYRVKTYSRHGWANTYESKVGDHDLDATMLALLGIELKYGLTKIPEKSALVSSIQHVAGFGLGLNPSAPGGFQQNPNPPSLRDAVRQKTGVPSRLTPQVALAGGPRPAAVSRNYYGGVDGLITSTPGFKRVVGMQRPNPRSGPVGSRTDIFRPGQGGGRRGSARGLYR